MGFIFTNKYFVVGFLGLSVVGCTPVQGPVITRGTVTPMEGGQYKSFVSSSTKALSLRIAALDAEKICQRAGNKRYVVISQEDKREGPELKTGNELLDTAISVSNVGEEIRKKTKFEVTTIFKCE